MVGNMPIVRAVCFFQLKTVDLSRNFFTTKKVIHFIMFILICASAWLVYNPIF